MAVKGCLMHVKQNNVNLSLVFTIYKWLNSTLNAMKKEKLHLNSL